jgi:hypothetical protein
MLNTSINEEDLRKYVKVVMDLEEKDKNKRATNLIDRITDLASTGRGNKGIAGTLWAGYNAITEFLSHNAGRNADNRFASLWFGNNANVLKKAHEYAMALVA